MRNMAAPLALENTPALDAAQLRSLLRAIAREFARAGVRRADSAIPPEQEATVVTLALVATSASDSKNVVSNFLELLVPLLAKTPEEIKILSRYIVSDEAQALLRQLFPAFIAARTGSSSAAPRQETEGQPSQAPNSSSSASSGQPDGMTSSRAREQAGPAGSGSLFAIWRWRKNDPRLQSLRLQSFEAKA